jgi:phosphate transport system permease protein
MVASPNPQPNPVDFSKSRRTLTSRRGGLSAVSGDKVFYGTTLFFAVGVLVIALLIGLQLWRASAPAMSQFGMSFLTSSEWNPNPNDPTKADYGAWPFIFGTVVSSFLALLIAVPIGIGSAIFLAELAPRWIRTPLSFSVELLAAVPSVVYGLWGRLVMVPWLAERQDFLNTDVFDFLQRQETWLTQKTGVQAFSNYGLSHLVDSSGNGQNMLAGGLVLAIMVLPFITAVSREVIKAVPSTQREAAYGLGSTRWEAIKGPVLKYARSGIIGAVILALARALGETMAITMVIGNGDEVSPSLLAPASTLSSKLANEFNEASGLQLSALMYLALVLFGITIIVNAMARLMIWNMARSTKGAIRI